MQQQSVTPPQVRFSNQTSRDQPLEGCLFTMREAEFHFPPKLVTRKGVASSWKEDFPRSSEKRYHQPRNEAEVAAVVFEPDEMDEFGPMSADDEADDFQSSPYGSR